jgi:ElaB/YqjD/DUF883 family membrane-anchored ribosome-binding protein
MSPTNTENLKEHLGEAGSHLKQAASAAELIRERPLASFGVAFATGWIIAKLTRGSSDK